MLELDNGQYLTESLSIIDYFERPSPRVDYCRVTPRRQLARNIERTLEMRVTYDLAWWCTSPSHRSTMNRIRIKLQSCCPKCRPDCITLSSYWVMTVSFSPEINLVLLIALWRLFCSLCVTGGDLIADHPALRAWDPATGATRGRIVIPDVGECGSRNALRLSVSTLNKSIWRTKIKRDDLAAPSPANGRAVPKVTRK